MSRASHIGATTLISVLLSVSARAGFEPGQPLTKSAAQERVATHIVVGRLMAFHPLTAPATTIPGRSLSRFAAEIAVSDIERGKGIEPGGRVYALFSSPKTLQQLMTERGGAGGCGAWQLGPIPGEQVRVYLVLNGHNEFVADHPDSFSGLGRARHGEGSGRLADGAVIRTGMLLGMASLMGFSAGWLLRTRRAASRLVPPLSPYRPHCFREEIARPVAGGNPTRPSAPCPTLETV
jgi:hypothetical protein